VANIMPRPSLSSLTGFVESLQARPAWQRYLGSIVITGLVVLGRLSLDASWGRQHNRHLVFLPTVLLAAWLGGFGPGLVSALMSAVALDYLWTRADHGFTLPNPELMLFTFVAIAICALVQSLNLARAHAEAARESRERVLAIVAHDLGNPLSVIKMTSVKLQREGGADAVEAQRRLRTIDRAASRMEHLIRDLVDATRIEHGQLTLACAREEVEPVVQEVMELFAPLAQDHNIKLQLETVGPPGSVDCDRQRLLQVLGNLLDNAIKFTPEGGLITVRTLDQGDAIRFQVDDTGPGVAPEHIPHVFERYWKADSKGTGLGLYIAYSIVRAHGGALRVDSPAGSGASFSFSLPRRSRYRG
jgi:signal transduction histidine kinase